MALRFLVVVGFLSAAAAAAVPRPEPEVKPSDTDALAMFRHAADAHGILAGNWSTPDACAGRWTGVGCSSDGRRVTSLSLASLDLRGSLDPLSHLGELRALDLRGNRLNGTLDALLRGVPNLRLLYLSRNDLSGAVRTPSRGSPASCASTSPTTACAGLSRPPRSPTSPASSRSGSRTTSSPACSRTSPPPCPASRTSTPPTTSSPAGCPTPCAPSSASPRSLAMPASAGWRRGCRPVLSCRASLPRPRLPPQPPPRRSPWCRPTRLPPPPRLPSLRRHRHWPHRRDEMPRGA
ncbi:hypothetical protein ACQ4PT_016723 [Festuca glaucescens]